MRVLGSFKNPPAIEYQEDSTQVIPDLMIFFNENESIEETVVVRKLSKRLKDDLFEISDLTSLQFLNNYRLM